jgi:pyruvate formate lyase activating enzyme
LAGAAIFRNGDHSAHAETLPGRAETYRSVTGRELAPTLRFAERLAAIRKPVRVRFALVPGLTDDPANVDGIARFVAPIKNVEWVEVQPFHQLGAFKRKAMNLEYKTREYDDTDARE